MILLDTNVISEFMGPAPEQQVADWLDLQPRSSVWTTSINVYEILSGLFAMPAGKRRTALEAKFEQLLQSEHLGVPAELRLRLAEHAPHFARLLLDGQRAKAHLQAVQERAQRGGPGDGDFEIALQRVGKARPRHGFRVETFGGNEQDREVGGESVGGVMRRESAVSHPQRKQKRRKDGAPGSDYRLVHSLKVSICQNAQLIRCNSQRVGP